jgi:hypothetical protein
MSKKVTRKTASETEPESVTKTASELTQETPVQITEEIIIEMPKEMPTPALTKADIEKNIISQVDAAAQEFRDGFQFLEKYPHRVTIFGSARALPESLHYKAAAELAGRISAELSLVVVTGGGPGIMEAANKGARQAVPKNDVATSILPGQSTAPKARTKTIGLSIGLPREQSINEYVDDSMCFNHFFARKAMLAFADKAYVFFPGGFGTFDELFGILTLIQTHKIPRVPVILVGSDFWKPLAGFIRANMFENHASISKGDMHIYTISDDNDKILDIIKKGPNSEWWTDAD